jgi:hypothetical protein
MAESAWKNSKTFSKSPFKASNETKSNQAPNIPHAIAKTNAEVATSRIDHPPNITSARSAVGNATPNKSATKTPKTRNFLSSVSSS